MARDSFLKTAAPLGILTFAAVYNFPMELKDAKATAAEDAPFVYYRYCSDVRAAGKATVYRGDPGYGEHMDGDGDGIACEPYRGY